MKLTHLSTSRDCFGVHEVSVRIDNKKEYVYSLRSSFDVDEFEKLLRHHPGKALNYLKKVRIK